MEPVLPYILEDWISKNIPANPDITRSRRHIPASTSKEVTTVKATSDNYSIYPSAEPIDGDRYVMSRRKQRSAFDQVSEFDRGRIVAYRDCGLSFREIIVCWTKPNNCNADM
ncbi:hypothetical protein TNCV_524571 [Trichonephila clavipes]|nr:hypothetical protein TNCV_524571 [Trichonephila clavipes]